MYSFKKQFLYWSSIKQSFKELELGDDYQTHKSFLEWTGESNVFGEI